MTHKAEELQEQVVKLEVQMQSMEAHLRQTVQVCSVAPWLPNPDAGSSRGDCAELRI